MCLAHGMIFENVEFLRDQKNPVLEKYAEIGTFLYLWIILKSSMLDVV